MLELDIVRLRLNDDPEKYLCVTSKHIKIKLAPYI